MSKHIVTKRAFGSDTNWCTISSYIDFDAAEPSDVGQAKKEVREEAKEYTDSQVRNLSDRITTISEQLGRQINSAVAGLRAALSSVQKEVAELRASRQRLEDRLNAGGPFQKVFQDITDQHLQHIDKKLSEFKKNAVSLRALAEERERADRMIEACRREREALEPALRAVQEGLSEADPRRRAGPRTCGRS
jgi:chromosome segregation ATPase